MNNPYTDVLCPHCGEFVNLIYGGDCPNCGEYIGKENDKYEDDDDEYDENKDDEDDEEE